MQTQLIDSIGQTDPFGAAESAIADWENALADSETTIGEILRLQEELEMLAAEEANLLADGTLNEATAAKKLNEIRARKELKLLKLESAKRNLGSSGAGVPGPELTNRLSVLLLKPDSMAAERETFLDRLTSHKASEVERQLKSLIVQLEKKARGRGRSFVGQFVGYPLR